MTKYCMTCGLLNELHSSDHPAICVSLLKATITELSGAMYSVLEGWTIPDGARKILEAAYYNRAALKEKTHE